MYLLGYDIGSSSIKVALVEADTNSVIKQVTYPEKEMEIKSPLPDWAEQDPDLWWNELVTATRKLLDNLTIDVDLIKSIGISYQMHGLVLVDDDLEVLRPSIIWCDSRAIAQGQTALEVLGADYCYSHLCNSPGNFTASKLLWVKENEPQVYKRIKYVLLPGDFIAMKMTGECRTTPSGLSEGIFWDFSSSSPSLPLIQKLGFREDFIPSITPSFSYQGNLTSEAAKELGLSSYTIVGYRAGDQPNNALSLGVLKEGQIAGTGGTSGVIYGVHSQPKADLSNSVNTFAHVNYTSEQPTVGVLLCINGAGSMYRWVNHQIANANTSYTEMEEAAQSVPIGADGLSILPFGNGAERMLGNRDLGAQIIGLQLNRHQKSHLYRAGLEGIAFAFFYGIEKMKDLGMPLSSMRVGNDNLFQSRVFSQTLANLIQGEINIIETTGAVGAARAAGVAVGLFSSLEEAVADIQMVGTYKPNSEYADHKSAYEQWNQILENTIKNHQYE